MNKTNVLCDKDRAMLTAFSKRTLAHLTVRMLPFVTDYMNTNVMKEVEKDRIIIEHAVAAFMADTSVDEPEIDDIFEQTKTVDRAFVKGLMIPSMAIKVRHEDIEDIRKARIRCLSKAVFRVLGNWPDSLEFEAGIRQAYSEQEFKATLAEILHLYNQETRALSSSINFLDPFSTAMKFFAGAIFDSMETAAKELTEECTTTIFEEKSDD